MHHTMHVLDASANGFRSAADRWLGGSGSLWGCVCVCVCMYVCARKSLKKNKPTLLGNPWVLVEYVPTFPPGQNYPRAHCYNTRQCTAAMPLVVKLQLLGEGIVVKVNNRKRTDRDRKTDSCCCWCRLLKLLRPVPLTCFFDGTKSEMIVINCLPYQLTQI